MTVNNNNNNFRNIRSLRHNKPQFDQSFAPPRQLGELESTDGELLEKEFAVYESPCTAQVSNDFSTRTEGKEMNICDSLFYGGCTTDFDDFDAESAVKVQLSFDYELHMVLGTNRSRTLASLEAMMLEHLASVTGLITCSSNTTERTRRRNLQELNSLNRKNNDDDLKGLSSTPIDEEDFSLDSCTVLVEGSVEFSNTFCRPYHGHISLYFDNSTSIGEEVETKNKLLRLIRSGMNSDVYVFGDVKKAVFIGTRPGEGANSDSDRPLQSSVFATEQQLNDDRPLSLFGIFIIVSFAALIAVVILAFLSLRLKRGKDDHTYTSSDHPESLTLQENQQAKSKSEEGNDEADVKSQKRESRSGKPVPLAEKDALTLESVATSLDFDDVSSLSTPHSTSKARPWPLPDSTQPFHPASKFFLNLSQDKETLMMTVPYLDSDSLDQSEVPGDCGATIIHCLSTMGDEESDDDIFHFDDEHHDEHHDEHDGEHHDEHDSDDVEEDKDMPILEQLRGLF